MAKRKKNIGENAEPVENFYQLVKLDAICDLPEKGEVALSQHDIEKLIITVRGEQVLIDRDLAFIYQVEVKQMNRQVKRNIERFPDDYSTIILKAYRKHLKRKENRTL